MTQENGKLVSRFKGIHFAGGGAIFTVFPATSLIMLDLGMYNQTQIMLISRSFKFKTVPDKII